MTTKISELPTGQKVGNILNETLNVGGAATTATTPTVTVPRASAATNAVHPVLRLQHTTSGTPAVGIGASLEFEVETATGNNEIGATIEAVTTDVTSTSEDFDLVFKTMAGGAAVAERARFSSTGQVISGGDGSTSAPAFRGTDANTGMYFIASEVQLVSDGTAGLVVRANSCFSSVPFSSRRPVEAKTSDSSLGNYTASNGSYFYTNRGAVATVTLTLSTATGQANRFVRVAAQAFRIEPSSGKAFRRANGTLETADKYLELGSDGAQLEVLYDGTEWICLTERGTITVEP